MKNIQLITNDTNHLTNYTNKISINNFNNLKALDDYDINIFNLNSSEIWQNKSTTSNGPTTETKLSSDAVKHILQRPTFASALKPFANLAWKNPWNRKRGDIATIASASIQLAVNAIISAAVTVAIFWIIKAKESPTRLLTVEASVDNLAPTAPLQKWKCSKLFSL